MESRSWTQPVLETRVPDGFKTVTKCGQITNLFNRWPKRRFFQAMGQCETDGQSVRRQLLGMLQKEIGQPRHRKAAFAEGIAGAGSSHRLPQTKNATRNGCVREQIRPSADVFRLQQSIRGEFATTGTISASVWKKYRIVISKAISRNRTCLSDYQPRHEEGSAFRRSLGRISHARKMAPSAATSSTS